MRRYRQSRDRWRHTVEDMMSRFVPGGYQFGRGRRVGDDPRVTVQSEWRRYAERHQRVMSASVRGQGGTLRHLRRLAAQTPLSSLAQKEVVPIPGFGAEGPFLARGNVQDIVARIRRGWAKSQTVFQPVVKSPLFGPEGVRGKVGGPMGRTVDLLLRRSQEIFGGAPTVTFGGTAVEMRGPQGTMTIPMLYGQEMVGVPRAIMRAASTLEGGYQLDPIPDVARIPYAIEHPRIRVHGKGVHKLSTKTTYLQAIQEQLSLGITDPRQLQKAAAAAVSPFIRIEESPYMGYFQQYVGPVETQLGPNVTTLEQSISTVRQDLFRQAATPYGISYAKLVQETPLAILGELKKLEAKGLYLPFKAEQLLDRGMMSTVPFSRMTSFGQYADIARQHGQRAHRATLVKHAVESYKSGLAGGRRFTPHVMSAMEMEAERIHRTRMGTPSSIMARTGTILEERGKTPFFKYLPAEAGASSINRELTLALGVDASQVKKLQQKGAPEFVSMYREGVFKPHLGLMVGESFKTRPVIHKPGAFPSQYHVIMSEMAKPALLKYPETRKELLTNLLEQLGPLRGGQVGREQQRFLRQMARAVGGRSTKYGMHYGWVRETMGPEVIEWMPKGAKFRPGARDPWIPQIITHGAERLEYPQVKKVTQLIGDLNKRMERLGHPRGLPPLTLGFPVETFQAKNWETGLIEKRRIMGKPAPVHVRPGLHATSATLGLVPGTPSGFSPVGMKGKKLSREMISNIRSTPGRAAGQLADFLETQRAKAPASKETLNELSKMYSVLLGEGTSAMIRDPSIGQTSEEIAVTAKDFRKWLTGSREAEVIPGLKGAGITKPLPSIRQLEELTKTERLQGKAGLVTGALKGTILDPESPLWTKNLRIMTEGFTLPIGDKGIRVQQLVTPQFKKGFERALEYAKASGEWTAILSARNWDRAVQAMAEAGVTDPTAAGLTGKAITEFTSHVIGKEGALRRIMEPRLGGSGYFPNIQAFSSEKAASLFGVHLGFGEIGISTKDAAKLGILKDIRSAKKAGDAFYGLASADPEQGPGNVLGTIIKEIKGLEEGTVAGTYETYAIMRRDYDFDINSVTLQPWKAGVGGETEANRKIFQKLVGGFHEAQFGAKGSMRRRATDFNKAIEEIAGKRVITQEAVLKAFQDEDDLWKAVTRTEAWKAGKFEQFKAVLSGTKKYPAGAPGLLFQSFEKEGMSHPMALYFVDRFLGTKVGTPLAVTGYGKYLDWIGEAMKAGQIQDVKIEASKEAMFNAAALIGHAKQAVIKKAGITDIVLLDTLDTFLASGNEQKLRAGLKTELLKFHEDSLKALAQGEQFIGGEAGIAATTDYIVDVMSASRAQGQIVRNTLLDTLTGYSAKRLTPEEAVLKVKDLMWELGQADIPPDIRAAQQRVIYRAVGATMDPAEYAMANISEALEQAKVAGMAQVGETVDQSMGKIKDATAKETFWDNITGKFKRVQEWFTRPEAGEKFYHAKRAGLIIGGGLLGLAIIKSALFPGVEPPSDQKSYVDMAPPYMNAAMGPPRNLGYAIPGGGEMASITPNFGSPVGTPDQPVVVGPAMAVGPVAAVAPTNVGMGAPMPPSSHMAWNAGPPPSAARMPPPPMRATLDPISRIGFQTPIEGVDIGGFIPSVGSEFTATDLSSMGISGRISVDNFANDRYNAFMGDTLRQIQRGSITRFT